MQNEPEIIVNGHKLTEGQAMSVRVAMGNFAIQLSDKKFCRELGVDLAKSYHDRLTEVHNYMVKP